MEKLIGKSFKMNKNIKIDSENSAEQLFTKYQILNGIIYTNTGSDCFSNENQIQ